MPNAFIVKTNKNNPLKLFANAKPKTPNKGIKLKEAAKPKKSEIKEILAAFFVLISHKATKKRVWLAQKGASLKDRAKRLAK